MSYYVVYIDNCQIDKSQLIHSICCASEKEVVQDKIVIRITIIINDLSPE
jgi:hypothetical protein